MNDYKIVVLSSLCFLLYKDKSPDKKLALQMEVKALGAFCWEFVEVFILSQNIFIQPFLLLFLFLSFP